MKKGVKAAASLHSNVPPDWYHRSIRENILQRYWHRRRFGVVGKLIEPRGGKVLDVGCADGVFTKVFLEKSRADKVIGIDVLKTSVEWAKNHWKDKRMKFMVADAHKLPFESNSFDAAVALEVLEHVAQPERALAEIKRVLKKQGYAIFLVPTDNFLFKFIWFFWTKSRGKIWDETHIQTYSNNYLPRLSRKVGFAVERDKRFILGMLQAVKVRKN